MIDRGLLLRALLPLGALAAPCLSAASLVGRELGRHPLLGRPWLGVVYPPSWVLDWYRLGWADGARQDAFVDGLLWALATAAPFVLAMLVTGPPGGGRRDPLDRPAGSRLGGAAELRRLGTFGHRGPGIVVGLDGRRPLFDTGEAHALVLGPTRAGKGANNIVPTLLTWTGSKIV